MRVLNSPKKRQVSQEAYFVGKGEKSTKEFPHIKRLKNAVAREVKIVLVLPKRAAVEIIRMRVIQLVRANNEDVQMVKLSKLKISKNNLLQL